MRAASRARFPSTLRPRRTSRRLKRWADGLKRENVKVDKRRAGTGQLESHSAAYLVYGTTVLSYTHLSRELLDLEGRERPLLGGDEGSVPGSEAIAQATCQQAPSGDTSSLKKGT